MLTRERAVVAVALALAVVAAISVQAIGGWTTGYLSDDYSLLAQSLRAAPFQALEGHHYSPLLHLLFWLAAKNIIGAQALHSLALAGHLLNVVLVYLILRRLPGGSGLAAAAATFCFAVNPAGLEAIAWISAMGYVFVSIPLLAALYLVVREAPLDLSRLRWRLAILQCTAFLIWDWGVLLFPLAAIFLVYHFSLRRLPWRRTVSCLGPTAIVTATYLYLKLHFGFSLGYQVNILGVKQLRNLLAAPFVALFPQGSKAFYLSPFGIVSAVAVLASLAYGMRIDRTIRYLILGGLCCQLPHVFFGVLEARYLYFSVFFFIAASVLLVAKIPQRHVRIMLYLCLMSCHTVWAWQRSLLWRGAYEQAQAVKEQVAVAAGGYDGQFVLVNLPDSYGPEDYLWRPFVWRNGFTTVFPHVILVFTPDCSYRWQESPAPIINRADLHVVYGGMRIFEVSDASPGDWREFKVKPFSALAPSP